MSLAIEMTEAIIDIGNEYSVLPAGRVRDDGPYSGERFRDDILLPALRNNDTVKVIIDTALGYGSSFLEECFGGLVRNGPFDLQTLKRKLILISGTPAFDFYVEDIWQYIRDADSTARRRA